MKNLLTHWIWKDPIQDTPIDSVTASLAISPISNTISTPVRLNPPEMRRVPLMKQENYSLAI